MDFPITYMAAKDNFFQYGADKMFSVYFFILEISNRHSTRNIKNIQDSFQHVTFRLELTQGYKNCERSWVWTYISTHRIWKLGICCNFIN